MTFNMNHKEVIDWINRNRRKTPHWTEKYPKWVIWVIGLFAGVGAILLALFVTGLLLGFHEMFI